MIYTSSLFFDKEKKVSMQGLLLSRGYDLKFTTPQYRSTVLDFKNEIPPIRDIAQSASNLIERLQTLNIGYVKEIQLSLFDWTSIVWKPGYTSEITFVKLSPQTIFQKLTTEPDDKVLSFDLRNAKEPDYGDEPFSYMHIREIFYVSLNEFLEKTGSFTSTEDELFTFLKGETFDTK